MTKQDRQKVSILVVLVVVLGFILFMVYRMNRPATTAVAQPPDNKTSTNPPAPSDARINLELVTRADDDEEQAGRTDLFRYREAPPPPPPVHQAGRPAQPPLPQQPAINSQPSPAGPPVPPPPPPVPLQYQGFAVNRIPGGAMTAFLAEGNIRHYNVTVGEVLMGRYRVSRISETFVEIEDLEFNRKQTLPLIK